MGSYA